MDCREARVAFAAAVLADLAVAGRALPPDARDHAATCAACRARFDHLARAVLVGGEDEISCAECLARLPECLDAERRGVAAAAEPLALAHLDACGDCAADWHAARLALADLRADLLPSPPEPPHIDLSFLPAAPPTPASTPIAKSTPSAKSMRLARWAAVGAGTVLVLAILTRGRVGPWGGQVPASATIAADGGGIATPGIDARTGEPASTPVARRRIPAVATAPAAVTAERIAMRGIPATVPPVPAATAVADASASASPTLEPIPPSATPSPPVPAPTSAATATAVAVPTQEPGGRRGADEPTATLTPDATPTPIMVWRCEPALPAMLGTLAGRCEAFPNASEYDVYRFEVGNRSRWAFSLCNRTELDTVLALYPDGAFSPAAPCLGILALSDDFCDRQSRLTVDLDPGAYLLVIAEKTGDVGGPYAFKVEADAQAQGSACPERQAP